MSNSSNKMTSFVDVFSGTGTVVNHFCKFSKRVIANDILYSNFVINKAFLNSARYNVRIRKVQVLINGLNNSKPLKGYCYKSYGNRYFTQKNASYIDAIREEIEKLKKKKNITRQEYYILLTSLLFAIDKVANTVGQYDAFLKHIGKESYDKRGRHLVDSNVYKKIDLKMPIISFKNNGNKIFNKDANILIREIKCDVLYLDPPYNHRQYVDSYHVLENIIRWKKPNLYGKTRKFRRDDLKSKYSQRIHATYVLEDLVNNADCKHIFLSYNNEGIIPDPEIIRIFKNRGKLKIYKTQYNIFGNGAGQSKRRSITERVFYCKVK